MVRVHVGLGALIWALVACQSSSTLKPFSSDGCSLFPDANAITHADWCDCCFDHDVAYWKGGTETERESADQALRDCVLLKTQDKVLAKMMYEGVRIGGSPYFYNWYRWGYGWSYERKYQALTKDEAAQAHALLQAFFEHTDKSQVCPMAESDSR